MVPQHPIYYVDFPDLKKIIERADNWQEVFAAVFVRKDFVTTTFGELEVIRNKVAHNRLATDEDVRIVTAALTKLKQDLGAERFTTLLSRATHILNIPQALIALRDEAELCSEACRQYHFADRLAMWGQVTKMWWFDDSYLAQDLEPIRRYFKLIQEYNLLPRGRGKGHMIEKWVKEHRLDESCQNVRIVIDRLVAETHAWQVADGSQP
jgi:hypothetical protein